MTNSSCSPPSVLTLVPLGVCPVQLAEGVMWIRVRYAEAANGVKQGAANEDEPMRPWRDQSRCRHLRCRVDTLD